MQEKNTDKRNAKEALKALRRSRKESIASVSARVREQKKVVKAIREHLQQGAATVPEVARAIGIPTAEVLWYMAGLKKYGEIIETEKDGSYFRYSLADRSEPLQPTGS